MREAIQQWLYRTGSHPEKSVKRFIAGFTLFAIAVAIIFAAVEAPLWQLPGLMLMLIGIILAAWGYVGIFAHRASQVVNQAANHRAANADKSTRE